MPAYRIYTLGSDGHFARAEEIECADDREAVRKTQQAVDGHAVELWERSRFITRLAPKRSKVLFVRDSVE
jgi:hypothetical protein